MNASLPIGAPEAPVLIACSGAADAPLPGPDQVGFKAHNLARMAALGLPVPPAFVLGTLWCQRPGGSDPQVWRSALGAVEASSGLHFGDPRRPLLLSVRSGAPVSMPGMMETLLNIGLSDETVPGFLRLTGNPRLVWDAYRRLVCGFGEVVFDVPGEAFEQDLRAVCAGVPERELDFVQLRELTRRHLSTVQRESGQTFPQDPVEQLRRAIDAVFKSWQADKARDYRRLHDLPDAMGTAVTVQRMVFGNAGGTSGAGVGFTRHPSTGEPQPWVDFLFNAQGEDVVSGRRSAEGHEALARDAAPVWQQLLAATRKLEADMADMQDFEFTVENGRLWMLQTRNGKRTAIARARIALDLLEEGVIDRSTARARTDDLDEAALLVSRVVAVDGAALAPLAQGVSAAHGVAIGEVALDEARATARSAAGVPVVLVRQDAETRDIVALEVARGLLTARGARTSHAAVVARQMGKVCVVACEGLQIDLPARRIRLGGRELDEGQTITIDGHSGAVYPGAASTVSEVPQGLMDRLARLRAEASQDHPVST